MPDVLEDDKIPVPTALLKTLEDAFNARLLSELQMHGGIPSLPPRELEFRDAVAAVLNYVVAPHRNS